MHDYRHVNHTADTYVSCVVDMSALMLYVMTVLCNSVCNRAYSVSTVI